MYRLVVQGQLENRFKKSRDSYMDISRDQDSFSPISRQGSILTLCHGG